VGFNRVRSIAVQATGDHTVTAAMTEIDQVLRREHRIRPGDSSDFTANNPAALLSTVQETMGIFTILIAGSPGSPCWWGVLES